MTRIRWMIPAFLAGTFLVAPGVPAQIRSDRVTAGLTVPTFVTQIPGDTERLFVLEQAGYIRIVKNGTLLTRPFLDINAVVNDQDNEQGLLGLAFDPDYDNNGEFYVYFTGGTGSGNSQIRRYTVSADPDSASATTSFRVLNVVQPAGQGNHKGGHIQFGDDGYLYLGLGDGGGAGDQGNRAQTGTTLLGKMLRINTVGDAYPADANNNYSIPSDNPFVNDPNVLDEIWALGLRNPYRWSFDRDTDDLYIADVGQGDWEEIDYETSSDPGGHNYGWRLMEGAHCFNPPTNCDDGSPVLTYPIHEYNHDPPPPGGTQYCSVTGGYVYRGSVLDPSLNGHYFFADYCADEIWSFRVVGGAVTEFSDWTSELRNSIDGFVVRDIVAFGEGQDGELYIVDRQASGDRARGALQNHPRHRRLRGLCRSSEVGISGARTSGTESVPGRGDVRSPARVGRNGRDRRVRRRGTPRADDSRRGARRGSPLVRVERVGLGEARRGRRLFHSGRRARRPPDAARRAPALRRHSSDEARTQRARASLSIALSAIAPLTTPVRTVRTNRSTRSTRLPRRCA